MVNNKASLSQYKCYSAVSITALILMVYIVNLIKAIQYGEPELKNELQGYINKIYAKCDANLKNPTVGAEVRFGHYSKGQSIIWKILKIQNNTLFIISSENICSQYYNDKYLHLVSSICILQCNLRQ